MNLRVLLAASLAGLACAASLPRTASAEGRDLRGYAAPDIQSRSGLNGLGSGVSLAAFRGRVVVLKFWFTGCPTCRSSLPEFQSLYARYAARGVQFVALAYDDAASVTSLIRSSGYTFPVAVDPDGVSPRRYGVVSYPTNYVIGADGVVKAYNDLSISVLERELAATPASQGNHNVSELGEVPPALATVKDAAAKNDYGLVLRIAQAHLDPAKDPAVVVQAASRFATLAKTRFDRRVERIQARWGTGDYVGAYGDVRRLAADFQGTSKGDWADRWVKLLEGTPEVKSRLVAGATPVGG